MADSDTPNLSKPKLIPIPGIKPKQEEKPPAEPAAPQETPPVSKEVLPVVPEEPPKQKADPPAPTTKAPEPEAAPPASTTKAPEPKAAPSAPTNIPTTQLVSPVSKTKKHSKEKTESAERHKLKLKNMMTPLYAKPTPPPMPLHGEQKERKPLEIPRAEPIAPEPEPAKPVIITQDTQADPALEETAEAQPLPEEQQPKPALEQPLQIPIPPAAEEQTDGGQQPEEEKVETLVRTTARKPSRKPLILGGGAVVGVVLLAVGYLVLDPFGHKLERIQPVSQVASSESASDSQDIGAAEGSIPEGRTFDPEILELDTYLNQLNAKDIRAVPNPEGVLIDNVFYAEGSPLNPHFGLVIEEISVSRSEVLLTLRDADSKLHQIPLNSASQ